MKGIIEHRKFLSQLIFNGEVSFVSFDDRNQPCIETKLYLDGDIICNLASEEVQNVDKHFEKINQQLSVLKNLKTYITSIIASATTFLGYLAQLQADLPPNTGFLLPLAGFATPLLLRKGFFKVAMRGFTLFSKLFFSNKAKAIGV